MNCSNFNKQEYPIIRQNIDKYLTELVSQQEIQKLEEWTLLKCSDIIFDSDIDNWSGNTSVFDDKVMNRSQLLFVILKSSIMTILCVSK